MRTETRYNGITDITVLIAENDKILRRRNTEEIFGREVALGYSYYIGGVLQDPPHLDVPGDFEEIDKPEDWVDADPYVEPDIPDAEALRIITDGQ